MSETHGGLLGAEARGAAALISIQSWMNSRSTLPSHGVRISMCLEGPVAS